MGGIADAAGLMFGGSDIDAPTIPNPDIKAGGIRVKYDYNNQQTQAFTLPERQALLDRISGNYKNLASGLRGLQPRVSGAFQGAIDRTSGLMDRVKPGFGDLTDAAVTAIDRGRERATSNLRGELNKRRILGSSFANDQIARTELDFTEKEKAARAESFLQELDLTSQLNELKLQQETAGIDADMQLMQSALQADRASDEVQLEELNNLYNAASSLAALQMQVATENARLQYDADLQTANAKMEGLGFAMSFATGGFSGGSGGGEAPRPAALYG